jgi:ATP-binding cassette subfamily B protein
MKSKSWSLPGLYQGQLAPYLGALSAAGAASLASYLPPFLLRSILDSGLGRAPWTLPHPLSDLVAGEIGRAVLLMVTFALVSGALSFLAGFGTQKCAESLTRKLRERLYGHIQALRYDDLSQSPTGDWVQRCTTDVDTMRRLWALQLPELIGSIFQTAWAVPILFLIQPDLAWFAIPLVPVVMLFSSVFFIKIQRAFRSSDESEGRLSAILQENIIGVRVVKAFARQEFEVARFGKENRNYRKVTRRVINLFAIYWGSVNLLSMLQTGLVLFVGIGFVLEGRATVGTVILFLSMTGMLIWPIRQLGRVLTDMGKARIAWSRIGDIFRLRAEDLETGADGTRQSLVRPLSGRIEFRNVSVNRGGHAILRDLSLKLEAGKTAALLGPTGSGKTTLVLLLAGLLDYEGEIFLDERELRTIPRKELRAQVGLVLQEPYLFAKTIAQNIGLAHTDSRQNEVVEAARTASLHEVVQSFHHGYETLLGERGVTLSGGQRQRTAISQMLLRPRPILIFDDSLSALDNRTDSLIRRALSQKARSTTILISHRLSSLSQADIIFVLDKGRLVQTGNPAELVKVPGLYRRMAELQNALKKEWTLSEA